MNGELLGITIISTIFSSFRVLFVGTGIIVLHSKNYEPVKVERKQKISDLKMIEVSFFGDFQPCQKPFPGVIFTVQQYTKRSLLIVMNCSAEAC